MSLFRKKQEDRRINTEYNEVPVPVVGPHDGLTATDYKLAVQLAEFESDFERKCKQWLANAKPDPYNRGYMDLMIDELKNDALKSLNAQEADHQKVICDLNGVWKADLVKARASLEQTRKLREDTDRELDKLERIYFRGTAYEEAAVQEVKADE